MQPTEFYGNYKLSEIERTVLYEQYGEKDIVRVREFFEYTSKETQKYNYMHDFTRIFEGDIEGVFYDSMHTDERGNKIIADKIFKAIEKYI